MTRVGYLLVALTGATGLVYQGAWQRYLSRLLGGDSLATATVLGVFLGGLSLGCLVWGRISSRTTRLFLAYGALEGLVGLWALVFPWIYSGVDGLTSSWEFAPRSKLLWQGTVCATVLIGAPTVCMGATLPLLTRALSSSLERATPVNARLYALNTLGGAAGALAAGLLAIRFLGLAGTMRAAGLLNLAAAGYFLWVGRAAAALPRAERGGGAPRAAAPQAAPARWPLYAIGFLGGFAFMTLETLVLRLTNLSVGSSAYSLPLVITACLLCIALGAFAAGRRAKIRSRTLMLNQAVACLSLMPVFFTLDKWPYAAHLLRGRFGVTLLDFVQYELAVGGALCLLLALPVGCMGATLPLAFDALKAGLGDVGRTAGSLWAWNALGNLLGGLIGGYAVYRLLGIGEVFLLVVVLTGITALLAALPLCRGARSWAAVPLVAAGALAWLFPAHDPLRFAVGTFHLHGAPQIGAGGVDEFYRSFHAGRTIVAYRDEPEATLAVVENPRLAEALRQQFPGLGRSIVAVPSAFGEDGPRPRSIVINGKTDSSTFYDRETLRLAAHLPALLAPRRDRALVIGLGTGVTVGELALYPDVGSIDVAEISPGVVRLLPLFEEWTGRVHADPRLQIHVGDAFRILRRSNERWNLIISEPSNPWTAGVDQLFSREFYALVRRHLEPDGIFLGWVQRYATNETIAALAINSLSAEFPFARVFRAGSDDLVVASLAPLADEALERAATALRAHAAVAASLAEIRVRGVPDLLARERPEVLGRAAALGQLGFETLDRPRIHFLAWIAFFRGDDPDAAQ